MLSLRPELKHPIFSVSYPLWEDERQIHIWELPYNVPLTHCDPSLRDCSYFLYDGCSNTYNDALINFHAEGSNKHYMPIDVQAYYVLAFRVSQGLPLFDLPISWKEVAWGCQWLRQEQDAGRGIYLQVDPSVKEEPPHGSDPIWAEVLNAAWFLRKDEMDELGEKSMMPSGSTEYEPSWFRRHMFLKTNIRAFYPPYLHSLTVQELLQVTYTLYTEESHFVSMCFRKEFQDFIPLVESRHDALMDLKHSELVDRRMFPRDWARNESPLYDPDDLSDSDSDMNSDSEEDSETISVCEMVAQCTMSVK